VPTASSLRCLHIQAISQQDNQGINPELVLIKAMVAAAKADGHVDADDGIKVTVNLIQGRIEIR
jgi:uncharacterized membrane protein YebE (DUF533 family)